VFDKICRVGKSALPTRFSVAGKAVPRWRFVDLCDHWQPAQHRPWLDRRPTMVFHQAWPARLDSRRWLQPPLDNQFLQIETPSGKFIRIDVDRHRHRGNKRWRTVCFIRRMPYPPTFRTSFVCRHDGTLEEQLVARERCPGCYRALKRECQRTGPQCSLGCGGTMISTFDSAAVLEKPASNVWAATGAVVDPSELSQLV